MKNDCLAAGLAELEAAGIRDVERVYGGKHLQLRWRVNGHATRMYSMPITPSDVRSPANTRAGIRRLLREDGALTTPEPKPKPATNPPDRITAMEHRIATLEQRLAKLENQSSLVSTANPRKETEYGR
jgi:hypothetical protein